MLHSEHKIFFIKKRVLIEKIFAIIPTKICSMRTGKDRYLNTFCESCKQPITLNAFQEAVSQGRFLTTGNIATVTQLCDMKCDTVVVSSCH